MKKIIDIIMLGIVICLLIFTFKLEKRSPVYDLRLYANGNIRDISFIKPKLITTSLGKLKFKTISFYTNNKLRDGVLSEKQKINSPSGELRIDAQFISFYKNGNINTCRLTRPQIINTPVGELLFNDIYFYDSKELRAGMLEGTQWIETPIGKLQLTSIIEFYKSGEIKECYVAKPTIIDGFKYEAYDKIILNKRGKIVDNYEQLEDSINKE